METVSAEGAIAPVLVVEDERGSAQLIASLCQELGLATQQARSASEVQAQVQAGVVFSCAVVDLVLAESDGFTVAQALRAQRPGLPIVVVSGVYKQLPSEFVAKIAPEVFLPKPFEPSRLKAELARLCKVAPPKPAEGELAQKPAAAIYVELLRQKASGVLTLTREQTVRKLHFQGGAIRFAQSNVKSEAAGQAQVASGLIKQASFDRAVALARQQKIALHEALAAARVLTLEQLKAALKQQTVEVAEAGLDWKDGKHSFEAQPAEQQNQLPDARTSPVALVLEWAKRHDTAAEARKWLEQRVGDRMSRSPELEREMFALRAHWPGEGVTPLAASGRTVGEVLARVKEAELPLLHGLCLSGLVTLTRAGGGAGAPHPAAGRAAAEEDKGKVFSAKEHEARRMLFAERDRLKDASHYEVLGIAEKASDAEVRAAYIAAARRYHSDSFSGLELGSARRAGEELFQKVNEANSVLGSPKQRAEYDVYLDRKAKGLPTDVAAILKAESIFQKGEALFKAGKLEDAEAAFREAIALNHAEAEFHAYLGLVLFKRRGRWQDAIDHVEKALELDPRLLSGQVFYATLKADQGDVDAAKKLLRKVIEQSPDYAPARAELQRIVRAPAEPPKKPGFFGGLFKK